MRHRALPKVEPTRLDRLIAHLAPERAIARHQARTMLAATGGYNAGHKSRRQAAGWRPKGGSADADTLPNIQTLRDRSRDAARNQPLAGGAISTAVVNVVGTGVRPQAQIDGDLLGFDDEARATWERAAERTWRAWAESQDCDATRTQTFAELQGLVFRSTLESGDVFVLKRHIERPGSRLALAIQLLEADRVSNPNHKADGTAAGAEAGNTIAGGVELDPDGAPVAYHIRDRHPGDLRPGTGTWSRLEAFGASSGRRLVLHLYDKRRPGQTRGVPYLVPVLELLKQLSDYTEAELMAAVMNACFAITTKTVDENGLALNVETAASSTENEIVINSPGQIVDLDPNEELDSFTPGRPSTAFDPFFIAITRQIGVGLDLPFEVLIKHFTASYSASRAALEQAWQFWRVSRQWVCIRFCQPIYEDVITEAVLRGHLVAPGFLESAELRRAYLGTSWIGPAKISLDPAREQKADQGYVEMGVRSRADVAAMRDGTDWERVNAQLGKEERARQAEGVAAPAPAAVPALPAPAMPPGDGDEDETDDEEKAAI